jgi:4-deoxy-L-threo-5-hexosulose-uronate ketol-isomerase
MRRGGVLAGMTPVSGPTPDTVECAPQRRIRIQAMKFETRHATHPSLIPTADSAKLRELYHIGGIFVPDDVSLTFSHVERMIVGGVMPVTRPVELNEVPALSKGPFLARRELGVINVGGNGKVVVDGKEWPLAAREGLYVPQGTNTLVFISDSRESPAKFYLASTPAHARYETVKIDLARANPMPVGSPATANARTIYQYINPDICKSAQLLMGLTSLKEGSVWNTMPCHLHERRAETYFYFDLKPDARVVHIMGEPHETRHIFVANEEAVISPPWGIHTGCGTSNYSFIWAMGGENLEYKDVAWVPMDALR